MNDIGIGVTEGGGTALYGFSNLKYSKSGAFCVQN